MGEVLKGPKVTVILQFSFSKINITYYSSAAVHGAEEDVVETCRHSGRRCPGPAVMTVSRGCSPAWLALKLFRVEGFQHTRCCTLVVPRPFSCT